MRFRASPLLVAVALGLLNPEALEADLVEGRARKADPRTAPSGEHAPAGAAAPEASAGEATRADG